MSPYAQPPEPPYRLYGASQHTTSVYPRSHHQCFSRKKEKTNTCSCRQQPDARVADFYLVRLDPAQSSSTWAIARNGWLKTIVEVTGVMTPTGTAEKTPRREIDVMPRNFCKSAQNRGASGVTERFLQRQHGATEWKSCSCLIYNSIQQICWWISMMSSDITDCLDLTRCSSADLRQPW